MITRRIARMSRGGCGNGWADDDVAHGTVCLSDAEPVSPPEWVSRVSDVRGRGALAAGAEAGSTMT
jgi:hypothetical protein